MDEKERTFDEQAEELVSIVRPVVEADPSFILEVMRAITRVRIMAIKAEAERRQAVTEAGLICRGQV